MRREVVLKVNEEQALLFEEAMDDYKSSHGLVARAEASERMMRLLYRIDHAGHVAFFDIRGLDDAEPANLFEVMAGFTDPCDLGDLDGDRVSHPDMAAVVLDAEGKPVVGYMGISIVAGAGVGFDANNKLIPLEPSTVVVKAAEVRAARLYNALCDGVERVLSQHGFERTDDLLFEELVNYARRVTGAER